MKNLLLFLLLVPTLAFGQGKKTSELPVKSTAPGDKAIIVDSNNVNYAAPIGDEVAALQAGKVAAESHAVNVENPHEVTATQVGAETTQQLDARDVVNRDRSNHSGVQSIDTVDGLTSALDDRETSSQATLRSLADRDRANHSGTQPIASITDLQDVLDLKVDIADLTQAFADYVGATPGATAALQDLADLLVVNPDLAANLVKLSPEKNHVQAFHFTPGKYYSPGSGQVISSPAYRSVGFIEVDEGEIYTISGTEVGALVTVAQTAEYAGVFQSVGTISNPAVGLTVSIPTGYHYLWINLTDNGQDTTTFDATVQVERGSVATNYQPYRGVISFSDLERSDELAALLSEVDGGTLEEEKSKNLIALSEVDFIKRYSTGSGGFIADTEGIAATARIPVVVGETYTVSGAGIYNLAAPQGGYFADLASPTSVSNISFTVSNDGSGRKFTVPAGANFVVISLRKAGGSPGATTLDGDAQLEVGGVATDYVSGETRNVVPLNNIPSPLLSLLDGSSEVTQVIDDKSWYKYLKGEDQPYYRERWPLFQLGWLQRTRDVTVVTVGTSLTARTIEHHSEHPSASVRPPLMHSRNLASYIWDKIAWPDQHYARYDEPSGGSEGSGVWATDYNLAEWGDGLYRHGLTRHSSTNGATFSREVPAGAWAWRLIYRTDQVAAQSITVTVSGGAGLMEVFNGIEWVEAHGYVFSQREQSPPIVSVYIPDPDTNQLVARSITTRSNTTYQKRLKFRAKGPTFDSRESSKILTFTATSGRLMYWGHEWSPREFMITYINAARGSHKTDATSALGLPRFADNEVHEFQPDLIYAELAIHNDGASGGVAWNTVERWGRLADNYIWRDDYALSLMTRAASFGYTPEVGLWTTSIGPNGHDGNGGLVYAMSGNTMQSGLDHHEYAIGWIRANHPETPALNGARRWVEAGKAIYGDISAAMAASSKTGPTMTNDGHHPNDIGSAILAKVVVGPLDFTK